MAEPEISERETFESRLTELAQIIPPELHLTLARWMGEFNKYKYAINIALARYNTTLQKIKKDTIEDEFLKDLPLVMNMELLHERTQELSTHYDDLSIVLVKFMIDVFKQVEAPKEGTV